MDRSSSYTLTFPNAGDGIQKFIFDKNESSWFKWPFKAPLSGYQTVLNWTDWYKPNGEHYSDYDEQANYIFRVRTMEDHDGQLASACYGKIKGDIRLYGDGVLRFHYYFNPDGTRNLEDDSEQNLFK